MSDRAKRSVFLLTDYGLSDEFVGVLKAVILRRAPSATIVDLTHGIPAFDVRAGALALLRAAPHLGPGVVVGVVDPGVASGTRRAVAFEVTTTLGDDAPSHFVGPDNGLLVWAAESLGEISAAVDVSQSAAGTPHGATFDGRDVFAPAAAALLNGTTLSELGVPVDPAGLTRLEEPVLAVRPGVIESEVLWVDGFGNVQLSVSSRHATEAGLGDQVEIRPVSGSGSGAGASVRTASARRVAAFADLAPGEIGLIVDSNGHLALVGDQSSAALTLGLAARDRVTVVGVP